MVAQRVLRAERGCVSVEPAATSNPGRARLLDSLRRVLRQPQAQVADRAIAEMHAKVTDEARDRARRSVALLRRLQERLGQDFWREHGADEVAFEVDAVGRVSVSAGDVRFIEADDRLLAVRGRDGHTELAEVGEDGLSAWIAAFPGEPAMN